jgi:thioredoxin reductase
MSSLPVGSAIEHVAVAVIGGGPAGLSAAAALAGRVDGEVRVIEREVATGGIPRHADHPGFGVRDLRRFLSGPDYARRLTERARDAGARLQTGAMVTGWAGERALEVTSAAGRVVVRADAVVLATGARERPRPARLIPGDRPDGVLTTGQLQNLVHLHHRPVGARAVVVGAELVSWSAVLTLRRAGCRTVLMTSEYPVPESYPAVNTLGRLWLGVPVARRTRIVRINGPRRAGGAGLVDGSGLAAGVGRVESVELERLDTGRRRTVPCDTVVLTGDWIPDNELARAAGLELDAGTRGPRVDAALRTSCPGVFAAGNLLHPVDAADVAALDGRHVAAAVRNWLRGKDEPAVAGTDLAGVDLEVEPPLRWVAPQIIRPGGAGAPARGRLLLWTDDPGAAPVIEAVQDGVVLSRRPLGRGAGPGRAVGVPVTLVDGARPNGGPVRLRIVAGPGRASR